jgi:hypothetical protein
MARRGGARQTTANTCLMACRSRGRKDCLAHRLVNSDDEDPQGMGASLCSRCSSERHSDLCSERARHCAGLAPEPATPPTGAGPPWQKRGVSGLIACAMTENVCARKPKRLFAATFIEKACLPHDHQSYPLGRRPSASVRACHDTRRTWPMSPDRLHDAGVPLTCWITGRRLSLFFPVRVRAPSPPSAGLAGSPRPTYHWHGAPTPSRTRMMRCGD